MPALRGAAGRGWHVHWLSVRSPDELDDEVRGWLCASNRLMGAQRRFDGAASV